MAAKASEEAFFVEQVGGTAGGIWMTKKQNTLGCVFIFPDYMLKLVSTIGLDCVDRCDTWNSPIIYTWQV